MKYNPIVLLIVVVAVIVALALMLNHQISHSHPAFLQGVIECKSYRAASKIAGRIDLLTVAEGDFVRKGDLLYTLSTPEIDAKLRQARALEQAAEAMDQEVMQGARIEQIETAWSLVQKAEAALRLAQQSYDRITRLYQEGVVPAQQYDEVVANYALREADTKAARAQYELALAGARSEVKAAARAKVSEAAGVVAEVEAYRADASVYAPSDGEISTLSAETGEVVGAGLPVVTILDLSTCYALLNIREELLPEFRIGTTFDAVVPALNQSVSFQVSYIASEADYTSFSATRSEGGFDLRTFKIKAVPLGQGFSLRPGMTVLINRNQILR
ncbi:MAG: HlyD family secretion protein [Alistipes sp.]|nr:HlyD family secretion protein [Alistipes sp.]